MQSWEIQFWTLKNMQKLSYNIPLKFKENIQIHIILLVYYEQTSSINKKYISEFAHAIFANQNHVSKRFA